MTVEQINKQLNVQDKLSKLSKEQQDAANAAMEKGLDLSNVSEDQLNTEVEKFAIQQEQASQVEKLSNAFNGIAATLGNSLTPLLEGLIPIVNLILLPIQAAAEGFKIMIDFLKEHIILAGILGTALTVIFARQIGLAVASIWSGIVGMLGPFGIPVAIAATIGAVSMIKSAMTVGDMASPADGKTQVSTKEGGLFELSPNDDIVAAPGLLSGGGMKSSAQSVQGDINVVFPKEGVNSIISGIKSNLNGGTNTSNATETNLQTVQTNTPTNSVQTQTNELATTTQSNITTNTNTTTPSGLSGLSVPLNAMIEELKALRADMASGKIGVFMDGSKVTAGIAKQVDKNTRNHYSMA
jgi:hypothetical protein